MIVTAQPEQVVLGRGLLAGETVAAELRDELKKVLVRAMRQGASQEEMLLMARAVIERFEPALAQVLADTELAAWIVGANAVGTDIPKRLDTVLAGAAPPLPPTTPAIPGFPDDDPIVTFPIAERGADSLESRNIVTRAKFDSVGQNARAQAFTVARVDSIDTIERIRDVLSESIRKGEGFQEFSKTISESLSDSRIGAGHLENVYRTNVQTAYHSAFDELASNPIVEELFPYQEYLAIRDARVRPQHLELESLGLSGTNIYRRDDPFWDFFRPPWDFQCILPGNSVRGRIHSGIKSFYDGEAVEIITSRGNHVTLTVNHPVFTPRGKVAAGLLREGDDLLRDSLWTESDSIRGLPTENEYDRPHIVEDVFCSLENVQGVVRVPVVGNDLHGDAKSGDGHIDVVGAKRVLLGDIKSAILDGLRNLRFASMNLRLIDISRASGGTQFTKPSLATARGFPGTSALALDGFPVSLNQLPLFQLGFGSSPNRNPSVRQSIVNYRAVAIERLRNLFQGLARGVSSDHLVNRKIDFRGRLSGFSGFLADRIVGIKHFHYSGPVYDFETCDGWQIAGGIKVTNCRCGVNLLSVERAAAKGVVEARKWHRTGIPPSNPEHRLDDIPFRPDQSFVTGRGSLIA